MLSVVEVIAGSPPGNGKSRSAAQKTLSWAVRHRLQAKLYIAKRERRPRW
jgi:hypothetical protein